MTCTICSDVLLENQPLLQVTTDRACIALDVHSCMLLPIWLDTYDMHAETKLEQQVYLHKCNRCDFAGHGGGLLLHRAPSSSDLYYSVGREVTS